MVNEKTAFSLRMMFARARHNSICFFCTSCKIQIPAYFFVSTSHKQVSGLPHFHLLIWCDAHIQHCCNILILKLPCVLSLQCQHCGSSRPEP